MIQNTERTKKFIEWLLFFFPSSTHLNPFPNNPWFLRVQYRSFENTVGKGEIAHNEQFLLFPQCFLTIQNFLLFSSNLKLLSENSFNLEESKICHLGKG